MKMRVHKLIKTIRISRINIRISRNEKRKLLPLAHSSRDFGLTDDWLTVRETLPNSSSSRCLTLIERNPPPGGFPYLLCSLIKKRE